MELYKNRELDPIPQSHEGSLQTIIDFEKVKPLIYNWNMPIVELRKVIKKWWVLEMYESLQIDNRNIGYNSSVYIVAEISANHGHNIQIAKDTIKAAKQAGADAVKFKHILQIQLQWTVIMNTFR